MAKPTPVTFPFLLLLLDWWPLGRWAPRRVPGAPLAGLLPPPRLWLEKAPLLLLSAASCVVTYLVQAGEGAVVGTGLIPLPARAANAAISAVRYLGKTVWPSGLAVFYPYRAMHDPAFATPWWQWSGALLLLAGVSVAAARAARRRPWFAVGWCWYLGALVPVIGLVQVGGQAMADRYTYLPLTGIFLLAAWGLAATAGGAPGRGLTTGAAATAVLLAALLTARQATYWRDSIALFGHAARATPGNFLALNNLGCALIAARRAPEAVAVLDEAVRANPRHCDAHYNLGNAFFPQERFGEALPAYQRALQCYLGESPRRTPLVADTLANIAASLFKLGRYAEAERFYEALLEIAPDDRDGRAALALSRTRLGKAPP
jgi:Flp pilus assembly protein TadD